MEEALSDLNELKNVILDVVDIRLSKPRIDIDIISLHSFRHEAAPLPEISVNEQMVLEPTPASVPTAFFE